MRSKRPSTSVPNADAVYEGRTLPRPHDELVDQGLAFDVWSPWSRAARR